MKPTERRKGGGRGQMMTKGIEDNSKIEKGNKHRK
jgi:hypothetical protein